MTKPKTMEDIINYDKNHYKDKNYSNIKIGD